MASQHELIDAETGQKFSSLELLVGASVAGVTFGDPQEVPFMNAGGTDFSYSAGFKFDGTGVQVTTLNGFVRVSTDAPAASGHIRGGNALAITAKSPHLAADRTLVTYAGGAGEKLLLGVDQGFAFGAIREAYLCFAQRGGISQFDGAGDNSNIELATVAASGEIGITYQTNVARFHQFTGRIRWQTTPVGYAINPGIAGPLVLGQHSATAVGAFVGLALSFQAGDLEVDNQAHVTTGGSCTFRGADVSGPVANAGGTYRGGDATLRGGNCTAAAGSRTGGDVIIQPGSGATAAGRILVNGVAPTAGATAGAGGAVPANAEEYLVVVVNGNVRKIPLFLA